MIHSLSGGILSENSLVDFAKVETTEGTFWFNSTGFKLNIGDNVLVPLNGNTLQGKVIRVDKNLSPQVTPIPLKHAKKIIKKI